MVNLGFPQKLVRSRVGGLQPIIPHNLSRTLPEKEEVSGPEGDRLLDRSNNKFTITLK